MEKDNCKPQYLRQGATYLLSRLSARRKGEPERSSYCIPKKKTHPIAQKD